MEVCSTLRGKLLHPLGSPEESVSKGNIAQHTKRDENRYLKR